MTATIIEHETIEHLDFEEAVPCEYHENCVNDPKYILSVKCCGKEIFYCEEHLFIALSMADQLNGKKIHCSFCGAIVTMSREHFHVKSI